MQLTIKESKVVFNRQRLVAVELGAKKTALRKQAGYVRLVARRSIRRRKRPSRPGEPPSAHTTPGIKTIFFIMDSRFDTAVVGPVKLQTNKSNISYKGTAARILEFGGSYVITEQQMWNGDWIRPRGNLRGDRLTRRRRIKIKKRPYMEPALAVGVKNGKVLDAWSGVYK